MVVGGLNLSQIPKKKFIPQKNNLDQISQVPAIILKGIDTPKKIANHFNQSLRHGLYFLNSCEILGWLENKKLTQEGLQVANANPKERFILTKKAVLKCLIFKLFENKFGKNWYNNLSHNNIAIFLEKELNFSTSTAIRRAYTLSTWARYIQKRHTENSKLPDKKYMQQKLRKKEIVIIKPIQINKSYFDAGILDKNGNVMIVLINCMNYGVRHNLKKVNRISNNSIKFILFISKKDNVKLKLAIRGEYKHLRNKIYKLEIAGKDKKKINEIINNYLKNNTKLIKTVENLIK